MTPKGIPGSGPKYTDTTNQPLATVAAVEPIAEAILTPLTAADAIKHLIQVLGHDVDEVAAIEVRRNGVIRILGKDRGLRTHRIEWPTNDEEEAE